MTLLDAEQIRAPITGRSREKLDNLEVFAEIESTNSYLLSEPPPPAGRFRVALAEHQTAGRGRLDRRWYSPASTGLCLSMAYTFALARADLPAATLAVGVGVARALEAVGITGVGLKWPNDLILRDGKLGGILTELRQRRGTTVVTGVGINVDLRLAREDDTMQPSVGAVSDLASCNIELPTRSVLSARLIEHLFDSLSTFEAGGLQPFTDDYARRDWLRGREVVIEDAARPVNGIADGVETDGSLVVRTAQGRQRVASGRVRLVAGRE